MSQHVMSQTRLAVDQQCKVLYHDEKDMVELEVGGTSLKLATSHFFMINEMMRKAAAKLVMQTQLVAKPAAIQAEQPVSVTEKFDLSQAHWFSQLGDESTDRVDVLFRQSLSVI